MLRIEQNLPARSRKRVEARIPRVGKGLSGFGIERASSREGFSVLDHQATPAARWDYKGLEVVATYHVGQPSAITSEMQIKEIPNGVEECNAH